MSRRGPPVSSGIAGMAKEGPIGQTGNVVGDYGRALRGLCYKWSCESPAERFFHLGNPALVALCGPCADQWLSQGRGLSPGFRPREVSRDEFLELANVMEVMSS